MNQNIILSIIIPHFNSSMILEKLLSSISNNPMIQTIVVDDKSELTHIEYIKKMQQKYNFEFYQNENIKSAGTCRNFGLSKAKGIWLLFADADDYFTEDFFEIIDNYLNTEHDVIFFNTTSIYLDTKEISDRHQSLNQVLDDYLNIQNKKNELTLRYKMPVPWGKLIKRRFVKDNKIFFDEVIAANDVMFSIKVGFFMKKFAISNKCIYVVTRGIGSLSSTFSDTIFDARTTVFIRKFHYLKKRLKVDDFQLLGLAGLGYIIGATQYSIRHALKVCYLFRREGVNLFKYEYSNPIFMFKRLILFITTSYNMKQYKRK